MFQLSEDILQNLLIEYCDIYSLISLHKTCVILYNLTNKKEFLDTCLHQFIKQKRFIQTDTSWLYTINQIIARSKSRKSLMSPQELIILAIQEDNVELIQLTEKDFKARINESDYYPLAIINNSINILAYKFKLASVNELLQPFGSSEIKRLYYDMLGKSIDPYNLIMYSVYNNKINNSSDDKIQYDILRANKELDMIKDDKIVKQKLPR